MKILKNIYKKAKKDSKYKKRLDQSFSLSTFKKSLTDESPTTIDISQITVANGEIKKR